VDPLLRKIDCVQVPVPDLDASLRFYRDGLGLELNFLVGSAAEAVGRVEALGGRVVSGPEDIPVGQVAQIADPFGNRLVLVDLSKGTFQTGPDGTVTGVG